MCFVALWRLLFLLWSEGAGVTRAGGQNARREEERKTEGGQTNWWGELSLSGTNRNDVRVEFHPFFSPLRVIHEVYNRRGLYTYALPC